MLSLQWQQFAIRRWILALPALFVLDSINCAKLCSETVFITEIRSSIVRTSVSVCILSKCSCADTVMYSLIVCQDLAFIAVIAVHQRSSAL
jgi:hypothetical protein